MNCRKHDFDGCGRTSSPKANFRRRCRNPTLPQAVLDLMVQAGALLKEEAYGHKVGEKERERERREESEGEKGGEGASASCRSQLLQQLRRARLT